MWNIGKASDEFKVILAHFLTRSVLYFSHYAFTYKSSEPPLASALMKLSPELMIGILHVKKKNACMSRVKVCVCVCVCVCV